MLDNQPHGAGIVVGHRYVLYRAALSEQDVAHRLFYIHRWEKSKVEHLGVDRVLMNTKVTYSARFSKFKSAFTHLSGTGMPEAVRGSNPAITVWATHFTSPVSGL